MRDSRVGSTSPFLQPRECSVGNRVDRRWNFGQWLLRGNDEHLQTLSDLQLAAKMDALRIDVEFGLEISSPEFFDLTRQRWEKIETRSNHEDCHVREWVF